MSRPARRLAAVPVPPASTTDWTTTLLTLAQLCARLQTSRSKVERDVAAGLPCIDIGRHHEGRRPKRSLRFSWPAVLSWYAGRR
ncbi:MAG TPA: hypothetical protein VGK94_08505 [Candidatus Polarisedimenticolia bacterium]|jgi:hypothetical protein